MSPRALHDKLERYYRARGLTGERLKTAVYGTMASVEANKGKKSASRKSSAKGKKK